MTTIWTQEDDSFLRQHYVTLRKEGCSNALKRSTSSVQNRAYRLGLRTTKGVAEQPTDEEAILARYRVLRSTRKTAKAMGLKLRLVARTIERHQAALPRLIVIDTMRKQITKDYLSLEYTSAQIAKRYGVDRSHLRKALKRWGVFIYRRRSLLLRKGVLKNPQGTGKSASGYKRPPTGWSGWYQGCHFRSSLELMFMIDMDRHGVYWEKAESMYSIPYRFEQQDRRYRPDFMIQDTLIEIKPKGLQERPVVVAKKEAAEAFCRSLGIRYQILDIQPDHVVIHDSYLAGDIVFSGEYETRFLKWVEVRSRQRVPTS